MGQHDNDVNDCTSISDRVKKTDDATPASNDDMGETAHKNEVGQHAKDVTETDDVTSACNDGKGKNAHKNEVGLNENIIHGYNCTW